MSLRAKFFIIVGVVIMFVVFVIVMLSRGNTENIIAVEPSITNTISTPKGNTQGSLKTQPPITPVVSGTPTAPSSDILDVSRSFAERFGSFSNQSNFENVQGLKPFMTPTMRTWADAFVRDATAKADSNAPYYGITTRTLEAVAGSVQEGSATVLVKTQRREVKGTASPRVFYQDLSLTLKKIGGEWRVEKATWK
ncbi:MAG: hypothetical protein Q7S16_05135 [bacterium]|nr:hypothetical protein [bacterium]